ncbi:hypothetical protein MO973_33750 [Paenibacillus sp. TRM 82003]|nr:hypothetical protein [Paenibacillus sp. TRM 82003]
MYIQRYDRLLPMVNDHTHELAKRMRAQAVPVEQGGGPAWRELRPDVTVTISPEAMDKWSVLSEETRRIKETAAASSAKLTDVEAFEAAFGPSPLAIYDQVTGLPVETAPLGRLDQLVELEARFRDNIRALVPADAQEDALKALEAASARVETKLMNDIMSEFGVVFGPKGTETQAIRQRVGELLEEKRQVFRAMTDRFDKDWEAYRIGGASASDVDFFRRLREHESAGGEAAWGENDLRAALNAAHALEAPFGDLSWRVSSKFDRTPTELEFAAHLGVLYGKGVLAMKAEGAGMDAVAAFSSALRERMQTLSEAHAERSRGKGRTVDIGLMTRYLDDVAAIPAENEAAFLQEAKALWARYKPDYAEATARLTSRPVNVGKLSLRALTPEALKRLVDYAWAQPPLHWEWLLTSS